MLKTLTPIQKLAIDCYKGNVTQYSQAEGEQILRNKMVEILGGLPENPAKFRRRFMQVKNEFFELVEETITVAQNMLAKDAFNGFCEFKNYDLGQKPVIKVKNTDLFKVSKIATGVTTLRAQKLYGEKVETEVFKMAVKAQEEWFDFITNQINWQETVDKVVESYNVDMANTISTTLFGAYDVMNTNMKESTNSVDAALKKIVQKVKGASGRGVKIYGTPAALDKIQGGTSHADADDKRNFGYVKVFNGCECVELPQVYDRDLGTFVVPDDLILVIPDGEAIIKAGYEGDMMVIENTESTNRNDMMIDFEYLRMAYVTVIASSIFGAVKITA